MKPFAPYALIASAVLVGGCASAGYDKAADTSISLRETANSISRGSAQVDATLATLTDLVNSPAENIKPQFQKFDDSVTKLASLSKEVGEDAADMEKQGSAYFKKWDEELAKINNEDIRSRSTERKSEVSERFSRVRVSYLRAKNAFTPLMSNLKDIRTALATDLTGAGLASIRSTANQAKGDAGPLRDSLGALAADFRALGVSLSSSSPVSQ
ncbi:MAG: DUF2959 family protein [Verrucomicrobia bacterium]|nr:DUF2959 family protein [Verrucomicrobiota bacterium]